jgi:uncharacterized membrane protein YcaP (DUF421 family)
MSELIELFRLSVSPIELLVRGSAMYWFLFLLFRFVLRRDTGSLAIADVLLLVLIADAAQNGMSGDYRSITDGFILVGTIAGWNLLVDWLGFHFKPLRHLLEPPELQLVRDGRILHANMRRELMTREDLMSKLRENGFEQLSEVKAAYMEGSGEISVLRAEGAAQPKPRAARARKPSTPTQ